MLILATVALCIEWGKVMFDRMSHKWAGCAVLALMASTAAAVAQSSATGQGAGTEKIALGVTAGTTGIGAEASFKAIGNFVVRLNAGGASLHTTKMQDSTNYSGNVRGFNAGVTGDWHPFDNGFRLSGGVRAVGANFAATASGASVTLNSHTYTAAQYGTLSLSAKNGNTIAPYLGLGWDSAHYSSSNWTVSFDLGAMYTGNPRIGLSATGNAPGLAADLAAEQQKLSDSFAKYGASQPYRINSRIARSSPPRVSGYIRPPIMSLRILVDGVQAQLSSGIGLSQTACS
jgi:hypothetical protein